MDRCAAAERGFTVIELVACVATGAAVLAGAATALQPAQDRERRLKDATQVRAMVQASIVFASNNADQLPLPSALDRAGTTVREQGRAKDTTANIMSIMIYAGMIAPELCVSTAEASAAIKVDPDYAYADPPSAVKPADALWDPAFAADFTGGKTGNVSYAHLQTSDGRMGKWSNTFASSDPLFGNRGPQIAEVIGGPGGPTRVRAAAPTSITSKIHGPSETWEGNIAHADGHVEFRTAFLPANAKEAELWPHYYNTAGVRTADVFFFDETDDAGRPAKGGDPAIPPRSNAYLGIFTKAGAAPEEFTAIWD